MRAVLSCSLLICLMMGGPVSAAPSLPITKPPVTPSASYTGPTNDTHATLGQWFINVATGNPEYRTHEFYDNPTNSGGGSMGHLAIYGRATNIVYSQLPLGGIVSFSINATVSNDCPALGVWASGSNSEGENLAASQQYTNTLKKVILTVDFATVEKYPGDFSSPYRSTDPYIVAVSNDFVAWYGWNVLRPDTTETIWGDFRVPGWSLGDLPPGSSKTITLSFSIPSDRPLGIQSSDPRYIAITSSESSGTDIFINRSLSLKISEWISDLALDEGDGSATNSNVSVFHNTVEEEENQAIVINSIHWQSSPPMVVVNSTGRSNSPSPQTIQCSTNLMTSNWVDVVTYQALPVPYTNSWTNLTQTGAVQFYRIIQP